MQIKGRFEVGLIVLQAIVIVCTAFKVGLVEGPVGVYAVPGGFDSWVL